MRKIVVITGQTATGKTSYALRYAKKINGELINADSRQVYKYLDIITGKDLPKFSIFNFQFSNSFDIGYYEIQGVPVWLYDVIDPKEPFSSFDYKECAVTVIDDIVSRGKTPIIVGGTYLYLRHLLYGFETETIGPDWKLREELNTKSVEELADILRSLDEKIFKDLNNSDQKNPRRLIRKIEIASAVKNSVRKTTSQQDIETRNDTRSDFIGFRFSDKEKLALKIEKRVEKRLRIGAVEEVQRLLKQGYKKTDPGLQTIGYKQLIEYIQGKESKETAIQKWITAEIQYAKRQYTFMKKDPNIIWNLI